ncbi:MAG: OmpH family outer membrane protein, partial [Desulfuromonadales bacterium]|nr:OmpH family outer membrane protein [Desulfuromonadales bacterium]
LLLFAAPAFAATKIAYVDLQKVLQSSQAGVQARADIAKLEKELETEFKIKEGEFLKFKGDLEKQADLLSKSAKQEKVQEFQKKLAELQSFKQKAQRILQNDDRKRTQSMVNELTVLLAKFGKDDGYSAIFERSEGGLLFIGDDVVNLTDKLIKAYDASKK